MQQSKFLQCCLEDMDQLRYVCFFKPLYMPIPMISGGQRRNVVDTLPICPASATVKTENKPSCSTVPKDRKHGLRFLKGRGKIGMTP